MRFPRVIVFEQDGRLATLLRPPVEGRKWLLREARQADSCFEQLSEGGPTVLVLRISSDPLRELKLLSRCKRSLPGVAVVAVGDHEGAEVLAGLAWDLGADFALFPPLPRDLLPGVVIGLLCGEGQGDV